MESTMRWACLLGVVCALAFFFCLEASTQERWHQWPDGIFRRIAPPVITPSPALPQEGPHAQQPPLLSEGIEQPCSPLPHTVLDQLPGTGSKSPTIGVKPPIKLELDQPTIDRLKDLLGGKLQLPPVSIIPPLADAT